MDIFNKLAEQFGQKKPEAGQPLEPINSVVEQSPEELELVAHIRKKIDQTRQTNSRIVKEGDTFTNMAYLRGFDGVYYDTSNKQFRSNDPKRKISRNRFKINKILPTVQNRLARLTQSPPKYDVRPKSNSSEDKDCARLGLEVINDVFDRQNFKEKQQEVLMNCMQGGIGYVQVTWDPMLGEPMVNPETQEMSYQGDVRLEVLNLFEVFPDPLAKSMDDCQWVIKAKVRKLDYFKDRYAERGAAVKEEEVWLSSSLYDLKSNATSAMGIGGQTSEQQKNSALELVYYEKRSKDHPNGRMVVTASGVLLENKEMPIGEFDIVKFDDILIGGSFYAEAIITHLRPVQDQYNILRTKCADWIKRTLGGKYIAAKGAGLSQEAINNDNGEVVEYNPVPGAQPPTAMVIPMIPQYVYEDTKQLSQEFDFISGINEASRGVAPGAQMPFRGMALLVEQDQTRISVQTNRNEQAYGRLGCAILKYVGKNYQMERILKVAGDGLAYAVKEFKGSDLGENYDVIVVAGSTVPTSKVLKRQDIINVFQMGLLGDPQDPKLRSKVLKMMEFGDVAEMWKDQALDEQCVKKAIASIEEGELPNPIGHEWDNHEMFIKQMNEYRKQDKFEKLSDEQKGMFNYVAEWHVNALVSLTNPQLPQQQMMAQHMVNTMQEMNQTGKLDAMVSQDPQVLPPPQAGAGMPGQSQMGA